MTKLENMGFRDKAYRLIESYLADRTFYTEVQGFSSGVKFMPTVSVVQGLKLSSLFYSLFTVDTLNFYKIMQDPVLYKQLTGKNLKEHKIISHKILTYVIATKTHKELQSYYQDVQEVLIAIYKHNSLCINGEKTEIMNFCR